jgi:endoglucanase
MKILPRFLPLLLGLAVAASSARADAFALNRRLGRGVNILSADPVWKNPDAGRMTAAHFALLRAAGFRNVRIPIHPFRAVVDPVHFTLDPKFLATLDWAIRTALKNDLLPIVDLHDYHEMSADPLGRRPMFLAVWQQLAVHCRDYPEEVLFELCNEPNIRPALWNELQDAARRVIRASNPRRTLVIGTVYGNQIQYLKDLKLPDDDRNLIVAIHYYEPIAFTHQGAPWSKKGKDQKNVSWTATAAQQAVVVQAFDIAQAWSRENQRPLTLGEFGAYGKAAMTDRKIWTNFIAREAERRGWSWSYWQFDSDFVLYDHAAQHWVEPILDALIPAAAKTNP